MSFSGRVRTVHNGIVRALLPRCVAVGHRACITSSNGVVEGRVEALDDGMATIVTYGDVAGVAADAEVGCTPCSDLQLGTCALGRAIDAAASPLDGGPPLRGRIVDVRPAAIVPAARVAIREPLWTGVRALDGLLTSGRGARVGIFGVAGTGKSSLLRNIAAHARCDACVVGLIGERGREAEAWIRARGRHTTIVCATGDRSATERVRATEIAFAQAHALRERGLHVLLILDSIARYAGALRELAIALGEPVGRGGFPASVFAQLARTLESAGATQTGSVTLFATVLEEGDDRDPVSEATRSVLDGHVALSTELARAGRFPAIDVPASTSRTMLAVVSNEHANLATRARAALAWLERTRDAREFGIAPADGLGESAPSARAALDEFLAQDDLPSAPGETVAALLRTCAAWP